MSTSKNFDRICCIVLAAVIAITALFMNGEKLGLTVAAKAMGYESRLFDQSKVHTIDIVMDDWDSFLETCTSEEYSACALVVDNESFKNVAIRGKGNTSLSSVKNYGNNRYSFKIEFDKYDSGKSYYGLDKLCLNNIIQDNTYMKDYLVYTMMNDFGVCSPLCSYVYLTVNGEDWGLYLAVEGVEDSFLQRNYGNDDVNLYKPDSMSMGGGRGNGKGFDMDEFSEENSNNEASSKAAAENTGGEAPTNSAGDNSGSENRPQMPDNFSEDFAEKFQNGEMPSMPDFESGEMPDFSSGDFTFPDMPGGNSDSEDGKRPEKPDSDSKGRNGGGMGGGMGSSDVKLIYSDDEYDSYSNIFDNAKTKISDGDKDTLIASLKAINEKTDIENVTDAETVIRYFVVHNFVLNFDSYTGSMIHNYYLAENDGRLSMIPWDYNLAFGGFMSMGEAETLVNYPIDSPVSGGDTDSRPMLSWILSSEEYTEQYHALFSDFIEQYFSSGRFETEIERVKEMISPYVEKDPTKFCTYDEFIKGIDTLKDFCILRAESVEKQLNGTIPSTSDGQSDTSSFVKADGITISDMGSMGNMGGGMPGGDFSASSFLTVTDKDGNEVDISDIIKDFSSITSINLSDGTSVEISNDFKSLMNIDISKIVSVTDKDGNVTDLSEYTISMNNQSFGRGRKNNSEKSSEGTEKAEETTTAQNNEKQSGVSEDNQTAQMPDGEAFTSGNPPEMPEGFTFDGSNPPEMPEGFTFDGSSFPGGGSGTPPQMPNGSKFPGFNQ